MLEVYYALKRNLLFCSRVYDSCKEINKIWLNFKSLFTCSQIDSYNLLINMKGETDFLFFHKNVVWSLYFAKESQLKHSKWWGNDASFTQRWLFVSLCVHIMCVCAAPVLCQLVWECSVGPFICLIKQKTPLKLKEGLEYVFPLASLSVTAA